MDKPQIGQNITASLDGESVSGEVLRVHDVPDFSGMEVHIELDTGDGVEFLNLSIDGVEWEPVE